MSTSKPLTSCALAVLAFCLASVKTTGASAPKIVPLPSWDGVQAADGWNASDPNCVKFVASDNGPSILTVRVDTLPAKGGMVHGNVHLPLDAVRGRQIEISVDIRATNVTKPIHEWAAVSSSLHVVSPSRNSQWFQASPNSPPYPFGYDWKTATFRASVPADATNAYLRLGLEESTGTAEFRNLHVTVIGNIPVPPLHPATGPLFTGHGKVALRGFQINPIMTAKEVELLGKWHANLVRFQLMWNSFPFSPADTASPAEFDRWLNGRLDHIDDLMPTFRKAGIRLVIDFHSSPGGREPNKIQRVFTDPMWQEHLAKAWESIARLYKGNNQIWGFDILNEPIPGPTKPGLLNWHDLAQEIALRIRKIDPDRTIIVEPDPGGSVTALADFDPIDVPRVVYSVHMYNPGSFTHQGVLGHPLGPVYPGLIDGDYWDKDRIRKNLKPVVEYSKAYHVAIYIGEFSATRWAPGADRYLSDVIEVMEENGWDWSYHAFREAQCWSTEIGEDIKVTTPSPTPTARLLLLQNALEKNTK